MDQKPSRARMRPFLRVAAGVTAGAVLGIAYSFTCNPAVAGFAGAFIGAISFGGQPAAARRPR